MISLRDVVTGFGNRDPLAEVWRRSLRGGGGGSTVITGVPPLRYIGDGRPLTDYLISGNAVQDGTPSAEAPVDAAGSGVRTGNLCNVSNENSLTYTSAYNNFLIDDDTQSIAITGNALFGFLVPVTPDTEYTVYANSTKYGLLRVREYSDKPSVWQDTSFIRQSINGTIGSAYNFIATAQTKWVVVTFYCDTVNVGAVISDVMLNLGSTALPYEPYGFKLPLTVNSTEYPIYLGQVESTRRIKKWVLTGEEFVYVYTNADIAFRVNTSDGMVSYRRCVCTHFPYQYTPGHSENDGVTAGAGDRNLYFTFSSSSAAQLGIVAGDTNSFKSYLAAQYQNGTPVTVWYALAEPETGIVNEPLMKIGDYADTISFAQAGAMIPTVSGENVLDVPTTVPPSEITIKGGISSV